MCICIVFDLSYAQWAFAHRFVFRLKKKIDFQLAHSAVQWSVCVCSSKLPKPIKASVHQMNLTVCTKLTRSKSLKSYSQIETPIKSGCNLAFCNKTIKSLEVSGSPVKLIDRFSCKRFCQQILVCGHGFS